MIRKILHRTARFDTARFDTARFDTARFDRLGSKRWARRGV
ncbi:hypothetical protein [Tropheryma whipplei]|nr:hypothetical protein [Tropheryma whipplei]